MAYGQWPRQDGQRGQQPGDDGSSPPPRWGYGQENDPRRLGQYEQGGNDQGGQRADSGGLWQPPEWRYGQQRYEQATGPQRYEQATGQRGYAPGEYQPQPGFQPQPTSQPGQRDYGFPPPQPPRSPRRGKSWPARHKALTGILAFVALIIISVAANAGKTSRGTGATAGLTTTASATATGAASATATGAPRHNATQAASTVKKAAAVTTTQARTAQTTAAPAHAPTVSHAVAPPASAPKAPAPAPRTAAAVVAPPAAAAPASCRPLTNGGNCYEPGEYCRTADHGASGMAGDGKAISCEDNDGWRWEPS
jgi:hypothetical protein